MIWLANYQIRSKFRLEHGSDQTLILFVNVFAIRTRTALGRMHVPPTTVFTQFAENKTRLKPCLAAATGGQYVYVGFSSRNKIPYCSAYTILEKAIRFLHLDYNPDRAQKLTSMSMSRHLSTCNISSKSMHAFLSNLANRQTNKHRQKHVLPSLSEVMSEWERKDKNRWGAGTARGLNRDKAMEIAKLTGSKNRL